MAEKTKERITANVWAVAPTSMVAANAILRFVGRAEAVSPS